MSTLTSRNLTVVFEIIDLSRTNLHVLPHALEELFSGTAGRWKTLEPALIPDDLRRILASANEFMTVKVDRLHTAGYRVLFALKDAKTGAWNVL